MRLLFLSRWYPYPPNNGSKLRIYHLLRGLAARHTVDLLSFYEGAAPADPDHDLPFCRSVQLVPWRGFDPRRASAARGFFSATPRSMLDAFVPEMAERIERTLADGAHDAVIASQIDMAAYHAHFAGRPALFEELELGVMRSRATEGSLASRLRGGLTWAKYRRHLARMLRHFAACTVVSEQERELALRSVPGFDRFAVVTNGVDAAAAAPYRRAAARRDDALIFTGSLTFAPNYEAVAWFLREVYPMVQSQRPAVGLTVTGDPGTRPLPAAANITLAGLVPDVRPLLAESTVALAPIWAGGGTRLKILEAMALGAPVVSTSKGAEGLDLRPGEEILLADTPADFAAAVVRLLNDEDLRRRIAANAARRVQECYDWQVILPPFLSLVEGLAPA